MTATMEERFHCWLRHNQVLPTQSIVYRDGLFEGQFNQSVAEEIPQFKRAVDNVYVDRARPSLQVVCVVNRHHQRFYPGKENTTPNGNVLPGICVDLSVRGGQRLDTRTVFASPTTPSRKTARPVPHVLLHDEPACDIKELQLMVSRRRLATTICGYSIRHRLRARNQGPIARLAMSTSQFALRVCPEPFVWFVSRSFTASSCNEHALVECRF